MQRSFSIVHDDDDDDDILEGLVSTADAEVNSPRTKTQDFSSSETEESRTHSPQKLPLNARKPEALSRKPSSSGLAAAKPGRKTSHSSDSDDASTRQKKLPGQYDAREFDGLEVGTDVSEVFQYINRYTPQHMASDYKFKPFVPEFLPAVGDIDAFLKVVPPETTLAGSIFDENILQLGLLVLDEPAANQSDPALLHLLLRAANDSIITGNEQKNIVVKKIDNIEKNTKVIDKWIKDISLLHKTKSSPIVRYSQPMPDIDDLMQQWPEDLEQKFQQNEGFPKPLGDQSLSDYVEVVCNFLQIPVAKNKLESLHLLFSLYAAIKQTQLYQAQTAAGNPEKKSEAKDDGGFSSDQLMVD